jgi:ABC-type sugar transport system substrate-binding protein
MKKRVLCIVLCAIMAFAVLAGCGGKKETEAPKPEETEAQSQQGGEENPLAAELKELGAPEADYSKYTVGFCGMTLNNEFHIILANAVKKSGEALGMNVLVQAGSVHASVDEQLVIIENYISQGVDAIVLVPASSEGLVSALQECKEAGIPVINLDTQLDQATRDALEWEIPFYGTDNYVGGQLVGEMVAGMYPDGAKVAILRGIQGHTNDADRYNGFLSKFEKADVVFEQHADWETDKGYTAIQNALQANPDIEVIYCENDNMGIGAYQAVEEAKLTDKIKIFSYDGVTEGLRYVVDGKFVCTCAQQPIQMGKLGIVNVAKILTGGEAEQYIDTGCKLITQDIAAETLQETIDYAQEISQ